MGPKVLIVDDEAYIRLLIEQSLEDLEDEGVELLSADNGAEALQIIRTESPQLVFLDVMMPEMNGFDVCQMVKRELGLNDIYIVMLTAKGEESDVILGLGVGADDYVVKPFKLKELLARVKAVLRRGPLLDEGPTGQRLEHNDLVIDKAKYLVTHRQKEIPLTLTEFKLLATLASAPGRVFTRELLLEKIQGEAYIDERNIDVHVRSIRKKLGDSSDYIVTVRGVGYKFKE